MNPFLLLSLLENFRYIDLCEIEMPVGRPHFTFHAAHIDSCKQNNENKHAIEQFIEFCMKI